MGWQVDWLYHLIFQDINNIWKQINVGDYKGDNEHLGPTPDYLVVKQFAGLSIQPYNDMEPKPLSAYFAEPVLRQWILSDAGFQSVRGKDTIIRTSHIKRGMFYETGAVSFGISPDRKIVALQYMVGPLYGAHRVFKVQGQGKRGKLRGKLVGHPDFTGWIS